MAMGSGLLLGAAVNSTGLIPDQAANAVKLAASGWRPLDILDKVDWETPVSSLTVFQLVSRAATVALRAL
ncbi:MAG: hypothetical protein OXC12_18695 [Spirochaetaceae bacterium]|nr:hypothetical protein [Spirochaetaceae bacterium]